MNKTGNIQRVIQRLNLIFSGSTFSKFSVSKVHSANICQTVKNMSLVMRCK